MPIPIFDQQSSLTLLEKVEEKKEKISPWSFLFTAILIIILVTMGEFAYRDSNRVFNSRYNDCYVPVSYNSVHFMQRVGVPSSSCNLLSYEATKLLLHADISIPILLLSSLVLVFTRKRKLYSTAKVILFSIYTFTAWMTIRLIFETESFLVKHYPLYGKYVVFITIAFVCMCLIMVIQNKLKKKAA